MTTPETSATAEDERVDSEASGAEKDVLVVAIACVLFLFTLFAVSTLLFLCKAPMTWVNATIALLVTLAFVATQADRKIRAVAITLGIVVASVALVSFYYDPSWDGNLYHKISVGLIKSGWNPIYQTLGDYANDSGRFLQRNWSGFYDGYPKASYIIGAGLYDVTGSIESGKAYTLVSMVGAIGSITVFLQEFGKIRWWQSLVVAFFMCVNAVSLGPVITFYNDAFLSMSIFGTIFALAYLALGTDRYRRYAYLLVFMNVVLGVNLKFSALFPFTIICVVFFVLLLCVRKWGRDPALMPGLSIGRVLGFFVFTAVCATVVFGVTSYVHNVFFYGNPLYPMIGANKVDVVSVAVPPVFKDLAPIQQFVGSLFSSVSNDMGMTSIPLKIPFTFDLAEAKTSVHSGGVTGGWGIWFSGILLVSLVVYGFVFRKVETKLNVMFLTIVAICIVPAFFIPALNGARYWPLPVLIPPLVLFLLFVTGALDAKKTVLVVALLAVNIALPAAGVVVATKRSWDAHRQFEELAAAERDGRRLAIALGPPILTTPGHEESQGTGTPEFHGMLFNLDDAGIRNFVHVKPSAIGNVKGEHGAVLYSIGTNSPIEFVYVFVSP